MLKHQLNKKRVMNLIVFFQGAGWFYGVVEAVQEEEDVCQVRFDGGKKPSVTKEIEELGRIW